jgi:phosphatidylglycerophosphatase C
VPATVVAAFDVDNTLTVRDCVVPFLQRVAGWAGVARGLLRHPVALTTAAVRWDRDALKAVATQGVLAGRSVAELDRLGAEFAREIVAGWLRSDTVARLGWHRAQGHDVVLVSASYEVYLREVGSRLGATGVLGTRLEVAGGVATGRLAGGNCRGPEKARRLDEWLERTHGGRGAVEVYAYGDSAGDRELLAYADHPLLVGREPVAAVPA